MVVAKSKGCMILELLREENEWIETHGLLTFRLPLIVSPQ